MTVTAATPIEVLGITGMDSPDETRQRGFLLGHNDQMDMVGHPTPAQQLGPTGGEVKQQELLVAAPVFVSQEDLLAVIAAMGDVMRHTRRHHPRLAGHWFDSTILSQIRIL